MTKHFYTWFTCCLFALMTVLPLNADEITVNDGTKTCEKVPVFGYYGDTSGEAQFVLSADGLADVAGGTISAMKFYASSNFTFTGIWEVKVKETSATGVSSSLESITDATLVYSGTIVIANNECSIPFSEEFAFSGDLNLLVDFKLKTTGNYSSSGSLLWYGVESGASRGGSTYSQSDFTFTPKVTLTYAPGAPITCARPGAIIFAPATDVTATTAAFSWTASSDNETSWGVIVKNGDDELVNTTVSGTPAYTITGLNPSSTYSLSVEIIHSCGVESSSRTGTLSFNTVCGTIANFPWSEDFEKAAAGNVAINCWTNKHVSGSGSSLFKVYTTANGSNATHQLQLPDMSGGTITRLTLPEMNIPAANEYEFMMSIYRTNSTFNENSPNEGVRVFVKYADQEDEIELGFLSRQYDAVHGDIPAEETPSQWYRYGLTLPNAGICNIILQGESQYCSSTYMDDILVRKLPNCKRVKNIQLSEVTTNKATITWTPGSAETKWNVIYKLNSEEPDTVVINNTPALVLNGLQSATRDTVAVTVQADCGDEQAEDLASATLIFNTECEVYESMTGEVVFDFEDISLTKIHTNPCWDTICPAGGLTVAWEVSSTHHGEGSQSAYLSALGVENKYGVLVTPAFQLGMDQELSVFVKESTTSDKDSVVFWINDQPTLEGATRIGSLNQPGTSWVEFRKALPDDWALGFIAFEQAYILVQAYAYKAIYVDDITLRDKPQCAPATAVKLDSVGTHAIRIAWTAGDENTQWLVNYSSKSGSFGDTKTVTDTKLLIEGLDENIEDSVFVSITAKCGSVASAEVCSGKFGFRTPVEPTPLPYVTDFEETNDNQKWLTANASTNKWFTGSATNSGEGAGVSMYISNDNGVSNAYTQSGAQYSWIYRTFIFDEADTYNLSFDWIANGESSFDYMVVVLVPDDVTPKSANSSTCVLGEISSFSNTVSESYAAKGYMSIKKSSSTTYFNGVTDWQNYKTSLEITKAGKYKLCFGWRQDSSSGTNPPAAIDNVNLAKKSCKDAKGIEVVSVGLDSAVIAWAPTHASYSVKVMNDTVALAPVALADTAVVIRGLKPATAYTLNVALVGICSETAVSDTLKKSVSFTTECPVISALPWSEGFDSITSGIPVCWDNSEGTTVYASSKWSYIASGHTGHAVRFNSYSNTNGNTNVLASPKIVLPTAPAELTFWCKNPAGGDYSVSIAADGGERVVKMSNLTGISDWTEKYIDLTAYAGQTIQLFFNGVSNYANGDAYLYLDDITIKEIPACAGPKNLHVIDSLATLTSVSYGWEASASTFKVHFVSSDSVLLGDTVVNDTKITFNGLQHSTTYKFALEVVTVCSATEEAADTLKGALSASTLCEHVTTLPWVENFDAITENSPIPNCWDNSEGNAEYPWEPYGYGHNSGKCLLFDNCYNGYNTYSILSTPEIELPTEAAELIFWMKSSYAGEYSVLIEADGGARQTLFSNTTDISSWTEKTVDLTSYAGQTVKLFFKAVSSYDDYSYAAVYLDDVKVRVKPTCFPATNLHAIDSLATQSSVSFGWTPNSDETSWRVVVKNGETELKNEVVNNTVCTITGLASSTQYNLHVEVYVRCSETDESEALEGNLSLSTLCDAISSFPWIENFDELTSGIPACWNNDEGTSGDSYKWSVNASGRSGKCLRFDSYSNSSGNTNVLSTPVVNLPEEPAEFIFWCKNATGGDFSVSISVDGAAREEVISSLTGISSWTEKKVDLAAHAGKSVQFFFNATSNWGSGDAYMYIDDIKLREKPSCIAASNLHAIDSLITTSSVSFGWTPSGDETSWRVVVKNGETELKNEVVTDTVCTINGLEASTAYTLHVEVYVKCGEIESEALEGTLNVTTRCEVISTLPWTEGFETLATGNSSSAAPLCWNLLNANAGSAPYIYVNTNASYVRTGSKSLFFSNSNVKMGYAILPEFEDLSNAMMMFSYKDENVTYSGSLDVGYLTDITDESTFVSLQNFPNSASWVDEATVYLNTVPAGARVAFRYGKAASSTVYYLGIDDIVVKEIPACVRPSSVTVAALTPDAASFTWEGNADNYSVEIFNGATRLDSVVVVASALPFVIDTLQPNTSYAFRFNVFGICGEEDGNSEARSTLLSIKTPCSMIAASELPFEEDFEAVTTGYSTYNLPDCWSRPLNENYPYVYNYSAHNSNKCLNFYGGAATSQRYVVLPGMESALSSLQIAFWYNHSSSYVGASYGSLTVGVMSDPSDTATFVAIQTLDKVSTYTNAEVVLAAAPANCHYIAFRFAGGTSSGYVYVDDINVSLAPSCKKVKNIAKGAVTANEASFTWESQGSESAWKVIITDLLHSSAELFNATVSSPVAALNNLTANTKYSVHVSVQAVCGENDEAEAVTADFTFRTDVSGEMVEAIGAGATFEADFSNAEERSHWLFIGEDEPNHFIFGTAEAALRGEATHGLYVSKNETDWDYNVNSSSATMAVRMFSIADDGVAGNDSIRVEFEWYAKGESTYDYARAFILDENDAYVVENHEAKVAGATLGTYSAASVEIEDVFNLHQGSNVVLNQVSVWQSLSEKFTLPSAGTYRLLFAWRNDGSTGEQQPFAVGNVKITNLQRSGEGTAVSTVENGVHVVKFINDGRVYILRDGVVYDILGTVVR